MFPGVCLLALSATVFRGSADAADVNLSAGAVTSCLEGLTLCPATGMCILSSWICDGENDCKDNWDEPTDCATRVCPEGQLKCNSGQCINKEMFCAGLAVCSDASVKPRDVCPKTTCPYGHVLCPSTEKCVRETWLCDGDNDCGDNWDEDYSTCREFKPDFVSLTRWKPGHVASAAAAAAAQAIFPSQLQRGDRPCLSAQQVKCRYNGRCVNMARFCTGHGGCGDETKIEDICPSVECEPGWSKCSTVEVCVRDDWFCDGAHDCLDGSDEDKTRCGAKRLLSLLRRTIN